MDRSLNWRLAWLDGSLNWRLAWLDGSLNWRLAWLDGGPDRWLAWLDGSVDRWLAWLDGSLDRWLAWLDGSLNGWLAWPDGSLNGWLAWPDGSLDRWLAWLDGSLNRWLAWLDGSLDRWLAWLDGSLNRRLTGSWWCSLNWWVARDHRRRSRDHGRGDRPRRVLGVALGDIRLCGSVSCVSLDCWRRSAGLSGWRSVCFARRRCVCLRRWRCVCLSRRRCVSDSWRWCICLSWWWRVGRWCLNDSRASGLRWCRRNGNWARGGRDRGGVSNDRSALVGRHRVAVARRGGQHRWGPHLCSSALIWSRSGRWYWPSPGVRWWDRVSIAGLSRGGVDGWRGVALMALVVSDDSRWRVGLGDI